MRLSAHASIVIHERPSCSLYGRFFFFSLALSHFISMFVIIIIIIIFPQYVFIDLCVCM